MFEKINHLSHVSSPFRCAWSPPDHRFLTCLRVAAHSPRQRKTEQETFSLRYVSFVLLYFDFWTILVYGRFDDSSHFVHVIVAHYGWASCVSIRRNLRNLFRLWSQRSVVDIITDINILYPICFTTRCTIESTQRSGKLSSINKHDISL